ncbi:MAG: efflux RND transporter periplasmic adaptor subunit [Phycisphaerales bacterium]|jgi:RND family efflux transporter MFP subunit|nr:efflux RND transporter periplasmic adaptor subunit [Phycisphaerales bacterium]
MTPVIRTIRPIALTVRLILPPVILAVGLWVGWLLFSARPVPAVVETIEAPTPVHVIDVPQIDVTIDVEAWGTVQPARQLTVHPQVGGMLVEVSDTLIPGGVFAKGEVIAKIDARDYEYALEQAEAGLETARFNLETEEGRGRVAERDWELLGGELGEGTEASRMALRAPHLAEKRAALASAKSRVEQAKLSLDRTRIEAPFNAMVVTESAETGQVVSSASSLGTLIGTDEYRVEIGVPLDDVSSMNLGGSEPVRAIVTMSTGAGGAVAYEGIVAGLTGSVDGAGRLARVLVTVPDPLAQAADRAVPLLLDSYVQVIIKGQPALGVRRLPRKALREGDVVWIAGADDRLAFRSVEVVGGDADSVLVHMAMQPGESIIGGPVPAATPGMLLTCEVAE